MKLDFDRENSQNFWEQQADNIAWMKRWEKPLVWNEPFAEWFAGGELNASHACVDVHTKTWRKNKIAIYWEDETGTTRTLSYHQLSLEVNKFADVLQRLGVIKGDKVVIYLPMIPEAAIAMLAVARLGATHVVVFSGFSSDALAGRIVDTQAKLVITADVALRRGKQINLKDIVDKALAQSPSVEKTLIVKRTSQPLNIVEGRDFVLHEVASRENVFVEPVPVASTHPLYILYTSGTTGKPKGLMHSTGGYLTYAYATFKWAFDPSDESVYWCTADIGWVTGHSYVVYAPLLHGATIFMYEGAPDFPDAAVWWRLVEKYKVSIFYTSPTALRMCMRLGDQWPAKHDLTSLKILGSVGEVINPEVWQWYHEKIGGRRCPIVDTWWQTETGGFMIAPTPGLDLIALKPGSATVPLPGIEAEVVDAAGNAVAQGTKGYLVIKKPWPGMSIGVYNDPERFKEVYWSKFKGMYYSGDYAIKDADGYFWLLGRADEVLNISGHRIGTAEIESAAVSLNEVAEAAAIGICDEIKGETVVIFAILKKGEEASDALNQKVINVVRASIGSFVTPRGVYFVDKLPKTRSGKIMRRLLKAVVEGQPIGDVSTLEDEASVEEVKEIFLSVKNFVEHRV